MLAPPPPSRDLSMALSGPANSVPLSTDFPPSKILDISFSAVSPSFNSCRVVSSCFFYQFLGGSRDKQVYSVCCVKLPSYHQFSALGPLSFASYIPNHPLPSPSPPSLYFSHCMCQYPDIPTLWCYTWGIKILKKQYGTCHCSCDLSLVVLTTH